MVVYIYIYKKKKFPFLAHFVDVYHRQGAAKSIIFVTTEVLPAASTIFVMTNICHDKSKLVTTKLFRNKLTFVVTKHIFGKHVFVTTNICCDKSFVMTKMILVAAPRNDICEPVVVECVTF